MAVGPRISAPPGAIEEENMLDVSSTRHSERGCELAERAKKPAQEQRQVVLVFQGGGALGAY